MSKKTDKKLKRIAVYYDSHDTSAELEKAPDAFSRVVDDLLGPRDGLPEDEAERVATEAVRAPPRQDQEEALEALLLKAN